MTETKLKKYLIGLAVFSYVMMTVLFVAIVTTNKYDQIIENQDKTIIELTSDLIATKQALAEIETDSRMIKELQNIKK